MLARLIAYVGALALLAIGGIHLWDQLPEIADAGLVTRTDWSVASHSKSAFAVSQLDSSAKTVSYEVRRHPEGGRKDILRWSTPGDRPVAELEIYRPGAELTGSGPAMADIAGRISAAIGSDDRSEPEAAGVIDSKFGLVTLIRVADGADGGPGCLGFFKRLTEPNLQISGWSCQGEALPARRAAISCGLSRLMLLAAGNDPKLADLFARAELRRTGCAAAPAADWVTGPENPGLRGTL